MRLSLLIVSRHFSIWKVVHLFLVWVLGDYLLVKHQVSQSGALPSVSSNAKSSQAKVDSLPAASVMPSKVSAPPSASPVTLSHPAPSTNAASASLAAAVAAAARAAFKQSGLTSHVPATVVVPSRTKSAPNPQPLSQTSKSSQAATTRRVVTVKALPTPTTSSKAYNRVVDEFKQSLAEKSEKVLISVFFGLPAALSVQWTDMSYLWSVCIS